MSATPCSCLAEPLDRNRRAQPTVRSYHAIDSNLSPAQAGSEKYSGVWGRSLRGHGKILRGSTQFKTEDYEAPLRFRDRSKCHKQD
jgi:hypothetical protein